MKCLIWFLSSLLISTVVTGTKSSSLNLAGNNLIKMKRNADIGTIDAHRNPRFFGLFGAYALHDHQHHYDSHQQYHHQPAPHHHHSPPQHFDTHHHHHHHHKREAEPGYGGYYGGLHRGYGHHYYGHHNHGHHHQEHCHHYGYGHVHCYGHSSYHK